MHKIAFERPKELDIKRTAPPPPPSVSEHSTDTEPSQLTVSLESYDETPRSFSSIVREQQQDKEETKQKQRNAKLKAYMKHRVNSVQNSEPQSEHGEQEETRSSGTVASQSLTQLENKELRTTTARSKISDDGTATESTNSTKITNLLTISTLTEPSNGDDSSSEDSNFLLDEDDESDDSSDADSGPEFDDSASAATDDTLAELEDRFPHIEPPEYVKDKKSWYLRARLLEKAGMHPSHATHFDKADFDVFQHASSLRIPRPSRALQQPQMFTPLPRDSVAAFIQNILAEPDGEANDISFHGSDVLYDFQSNAVCRDFLPPKAPKEHTFAEHIVHNITARVYRKAERVEALKMKNLFHRKHDRPLPKQQTRKRGQRSHRAMNNTSPTVGVDIGSGSASPLNSLSVTQRSRRSRRGIQSYQSTGSNETATSNDLGLRTSASSLGSDAILASQSGQSFASVTTPAEAPKRSTARKKTGHRHRLNEAMLSTAQTSKPKEDRALREEFAKYSEALREEEARAAATKAEQQSTAVDRQASVGGRGAYTAIDTNEAVNTDVISDDGTPIPTEILELADKRRAEREEIEKKAKAEAVEAKAMAAAASNTSADDDESEELDDEQRMQQIIADELKGRLQKKQRHLERKKKRKKREFVDNERTRLWSDNEVTRGKQAKQMMRMMQSMLEESNSSDELRSSDEEERDIEDILRDKMFRRRPSSSSESELSESSEADNGENATAEDEFRNVPDFDVNFSTAHTDRIEITSPLPNSSWVIGDIMVISWICHAPHVERVCINLYSRAQHLFEVGKGIHNGNGVYHWRVPINMNVASTYRIKITSEQAPHIFRFSGCYFALRPPPEPPSLRIGYTKRMKLDSGEIDLHKRWRDCKDVLPFTRIPHTFVDELQIDAADITDRDVSLSSDLSQPHMFTDKSYTHLPRVELHRGVGLAVTREIPTSTQHATELSDSGLAFHFPQAYFTYAGEWAYDATQDDEDRTIMSAGELSKHSRLRVQQGRGASAYADGGIHVGMYKRGERSGYGACTYPCGLKYEGGWQRGSWHGRGKTIDTSKNTYEGMFRKGKRHGKGNLLLAGGTEYDGEFKNGLFDGNGMLTSQSGITYEGRWKKGKICGVGTIYFHTGERVERVWKEQYLFDAVREYLVEQKLLKRQEKDRLDKLLLRDELERIYNSMLAERAAALERKRQEQQALRDEYIRRHNEWKEQKKREAEERKLEEERQLKEDIERLENNLGTKQALPTVWKRS